MDRGIVGEDRESKETDGCPLTAFTTISGGSLRLWHRRMGHLHIDAIHKLA
jgi:hypothetical protein